MRSKIVVEVGQTVNDWTVLSAPSVGKIVAACKCGFQKTDWAYRIFENVMCRNCRIEKQKFGNRNPDKALELAIRQVYSEYKGWAKSDARQFELGPGEFFSTLITSKCYYCGSQPKRILTKHGFDIAVTGIDRLDSMAGYVESNVVPCCTICNKMKNTLSEDEFLSHVKAIIYHRKGGDQ